jgi:DNA-binding phage protein
MAKQIQKQPTTNDLRQEVERSGIDLTKLAAEVGMSYPRFYRIIKRNKPLNFDEGIRIYNAVGKEIHVVSAS